MKKLILTTTVALLGACTTYRSDNHSIKYTTNYNTNVSPPKNNQSFSGGASLPDLASSESVEEQFKNPEEMTLDEVSPFIRPKPLLKKSTVVKTYIEPIRPSAVVPMAGVTPFPRNHWMNGHSQAPQLYFYGY